MMTNSDKDDRVAEYNKLAEPAVEIPAEIEDAEVHTASSPLAEISAKIDLLLKAQGLTYKATTNS